VGLVQRGRFITFEGGEGTGKSTQARRLAERLKASGLEVVVTREPGGSDGAEAIRRLVLEGSADRWSPTSETLLMYAARADHLERTIRPALVQGAWVVCDRFIDSTRAYQGAGGAAPASLIAALEREVVGEDQPDLTLVMDLDVQAGLARAVGRDALDRFESMDLGFHERLRQGFLDIARADPARCAVIAAAASPDEVEALVWAAVEARLGGVA
jgi:dTMP kinase